MQAFAVIPAAGRSRRMGQPKLLLPWHGRTLIEHTLAAWRASRVAQVVAVVHPDDHQLAEAVRGAGALVVQPPEPPSEMKDSVRLGLEFLGREFQPTAHDAWLLAPADMPGVTAESIDRLLTAYRQSVDEGREDLRTWCATSAGKRGHPVLFPWPLASEVGRLSAREGVSALVARYPVQEVEVEATTFPDLDTPADYDRWRQPSR